MARQTPLREALTKIRAQRDETRVDMAKSMDVSHTLAFAVESGKQPLALRYAQKLVAYFGPVPELEDAIVRQITNIKFSLPPSDPKNLKQRTFLYRLATSDKPLSEDAWEAMTDALELWS